MRLYYRKLVIILLLVSIIPIASYGVLFYKYSERKLEDEIMQNNTIALWNVSSIIDEKLDSLKADLFNFSLQNNYYLAYSYNDRIKSDERVSEITRLYVEINRIKSKHPYVNDIVLYYSQSDNVITSLGSMSVDLFLKNRMERDDFDSLCGFPKRFETILINNVIYISTTLPFNSLNPNAYIFIVLSRGEVQQEFDKIKIANNPIVATYFNDRNMFLLGGGDLSKNEIDSITEYMLDESKRTYIDDKYSVSQIYSESNGWEYLAFIPKKFINDKINILKYLNIILVASLLLIALILSVTMSKSLYKPLKGLLRKFGSDRKIRNEFDYLITNIDKIVLNNKVLEKKVLSSIPAIRERFIYNLLHESPEDFNESELGLYNFDFRGDKYAIAAFIYTFNKNETENIISRIFKDVSGFQIYTLDVDDILIAVLNFDSKISSLNQLIEHMKDHGIIK